jgi:cellulose synthase/poly-beta-1,6-N-acetylglucosamine synthase-like glycosyltransferase
VLAKGDVDAVVVVDADTSISDNLLAAFAARLSAGETALQARYGVENPDASWRTCLMAVALAAYHDVRSLGRERLGLSCGLRGNGMCVTTALLAEHPHVASSLVEDVEYGVELGLKGHRVAYVHEARVAGKMVTSSSASVSQRSRWEAGRGAMVSRYLGPLLRRAFGHASPMALDLAFDLLVPPLATVAGVTALGLVLSALLSLHAGYPVGAAIPWLVCSVLLAVHVARGWQLSGTGSRGALALLHVPGYVLWKLRIRLGRGARSTEWVRTAREGAPPLAGTPG